MEKKRRARINKCLDQLKSLLETYYSTNVRMADRSFSVINTFLGAFTYSGLEEPYLNNITFHLYTDSEAQTGKGWHPGADCETSEEPPKDTELWVVLVLDPHCRQTQHCWSTGNTCHELVSLTLRCLSIAGSAVASEFSDYQTGFRNCLANLNQYLVMADTLNGGDRWMLSQLSGKLCRSVGRGEVSSTMDSGRLGQTETQEEARSRHSSAAGPEEGNTGTFNTMKPRSTSTSCRLSSEDARPSPGGKHAAAAATASQNSHARSPSHKKCAPVRDRDQAAHTQHSVWRPW